MRKYLSVGNVVCGLITIFLLFAAIVMLDQEEQTMEALGGAVEAPVDRVLSANEGKVVVVSGKISHTGYSAYDETFEVGVDSPILKRNVDMYQWVEYTESYGNDIEYYYEREWSDSNPIRYSDNPSSKPYESRMFYSEVMLGEYRLAPELVEKMRFMGKWADVAGLGRGAADKYGLILSDDVLYYYQNPAGQYVDVGDARIYYEALDISGLSDITVAARQEGDMLVELRGDNNVFLVGNIYDGVMSAADVFGAREDDFAFAGITALVLILIFGLITALITRGNIKKYKLREKFGDVGSESKWRRK